MWVVSAGSATVHAFTLPPEVDRPTISQRQTVTVGSVTDTMALVEVDIARLVRAFGTVETAISVNLVDTFSSATMYVHPEGGIARFLLMGLRPETQYTLVVTYGVETKYHLGTAGRKIFRTKHARLDGIETSGLTHTEATVTVSLEGADVDRGCCFKFYPHSNRDEAGPDYTFYLRHKASDETEWTAPVELTFSDFVADTRLTGLDPGTAYDAEVAETADFMPPTATVASYTGTLTVGESDVGGDVLLGVDSAGELGDPFGSMSPDPTFTVAGTTRSVTNLFSHPYGGPGFDQPALYLEFDTGFGGQSGAGVEFTLTAGGMVYNSTDASREGIGLGWEWLLPPSWSKDDTVAVQIDFTATPESFREGTRLEVLGAFTTHHMPPTLAFDAEMTVGVSGQYDGYDSSTPVLGSISTNTFEVGGVQYSIKQLGYSSAVTKFEFNVSPNLPFDSFTLTLGSTELLSSSAGFQVVAGLGSYTWVGTDPSWTSGQVVDVKLDIGLINICDRSPAVAYAIKAATPSFDYCHMTSVLDLDDVTELDLPGGRGTGLKAGDFAGLSVLTHLDLSYYGLGGHSTNQLPVGVFDGLDSLTHLDISHTSLQNLNLGVFEGLDQLIELDLSDTSLQRGTVPVGAFDPLDNLEVLRITNLAEHYENAFSNLGDDIFEGLDNLLELDVRPSTPLRDSPLSLLPLTSLTTLNGRPYTRPADPPANFQYASGRIDHERGYSKTCYTVTLKWNAPSGVSGITGYRILRNLGAESLSRYAKQIATTGASVRSFVDGRDADVCFGGVGSGPNVSYFVSAITAGGDSFPARVRVDQTAQSFPTTQVPPTRLRCAAPCTTSDSVAKSPDGYKVRLQWNDLHHNITGYEISFRGSSSAAWRTIVVNAGNVLKYDLESVPVPPTAVPEDRREHDTCTTRSGTREYSIGFTDGREFRIRALNAAGAGQWSNVVRPFR